MQAARERAKHAHAPVVRRRRDAVLVLEVELLEALGVHAQMAIAVLRQQQQGAIVS